MKVDAGVLDRVCYYITGHGLGHATRSVRLVEELVAQHRIVYIVTHSNVIQFLQQSLPPQVYQKLVIHNRVLDGGAVQQGPLAVDALQTLSRYFNTIHTHREDLLLTEIEFLRENRIHTVLSDATPLACQAGRCAGCAVVAIVSNFTWCFIYLTMLRESDVLQGPQRSSYTDMVVQCEADYCAAHLYIQLPGATPVPRGMSEAKVRQGPLLARHPTLSRDEMRRKLRIPHTSKVLLLSFGGHENTWSLKDGYLPEGWCCIVLCTSLQQMPCDRFVSLPSDTYVPDIIEASDVVLGKLGYGFVSECLASAVPLVYISRSGWPEEEYLEQLMRSHHACVRMKIEDFHEGAWGSYLSEALLKRSEEAGRKDSRATRDIIAIIDDYARANSHTRDTA